MKDIRQILSEDLAKNYAGFAVTVMITLMA